MRSRTVEMPSFHSHMCSLHVKYEPWGKLKVRKPAFKPYHFQVGDSGQVPLLRFNFLPSVRLPFLSFQVSNFSCPLLQKKSRFSYVGGDGVSSRPCFQVLRWCPRTPAREVF